MKCYAQCMAVEALCANARRFGFIVGFGSNGKTEVRECNSGAGGVFRIWWAVINESRVLTEREDLRSAIIFALSSHMPEKGIADPPTLDALSIDDPHTRMCETDA